jgi:hypothetical protein
MAGLKPFHFPPARRRQRVAVLALKASQYNTVIWIIAILQAPVAHVMSHRQATFGGHN